MVYSLWGIVVFSLTLFYILLMLLYCIGWERSKIFRPSITELKDFPSVVVIIPARNEASNIIPCLNSLLAQDYPKKYTQLLVVDDCSDDETATLVEKLIDQGVNLLKMSDLGLEELKTGHKKKAIEMGIKHTNSHLILTTDADCILPKQWLSTMVDYYVHNSVQMATGPVIFSNKGENWWNRFLISIWQLDFIGMMGITGASLQLNLSKMANGANLMYERAAFDRVGGFSGIDHIASGDDLLLMEKIGKLPNAKIAFVKAKEAIVSTPAPLNISAFFQQRIRWTSKSRYYSDWKLKLILLIMLFFYLSLIINIVGILLAYPHFEMWICGQLCGKLIVDALFLGLCLHFFEKWRWMWIIIPAEVFQIFYIIGIGILGNFKKYEWKGRRVR